MDIDQLSANFKNKIEALIKRIAINQVVFFSEEIQSKYNSELELDAWLSNNNKIVADSAMLFNNVESFAKDAQPTQELENDQLKASFEDSIGFLTNQIDIACRTGENRYEINELLKETILKLNNQCARLNYKSWFELHNPLINDKVFFIVYRNKRIGYPLQHLQFDTCRHLINQEFLFRKNLLLQLKEAIVEIYSEYLLLPDNPTIPVIKYQCNAVDICELTIAIVESKLIGLTAVESEKFKAILLQIFNVNSTVFTKSKHEIFKRKVNGNGRNKFMEKLSDEFSKN